MLYPITTCITIVSNINSKKQIKKSFNKNNININIKEANIFKIEINIKK